MADLASVFQALQLADQQARIDSPYAPLASAGDQVGDLFIQNANKGSLKENILAGLISGIISGGSQNLTNRFVDKQNALAQNLMFDAISGNNVLKPRGMSPSVFSTIDNTGKLFAIQNALENQVSRDKAETDLNNLITGELVKGTFNNPYRARKALDVLSPLLGREVAESQPIVRSNEIDSANVPEEIGSVPSGLTFEQYLNKSQGDESLARDLYKRDLEQPKERFEQVSALRKEFHALPVVKSFELSDIGIQSLRKAIADPSSTSDLELVRGAIQAIEPGMAVREGEQAAVAASGSIPDQWKAQLGKALTGGSGLSPEVREGILRIAERRYAGYAEKFNQAKDFYQNQAGDQRLPLGKEGISYLKPSDSSNISSSPPISNDTRVNLPREQASNIMTRTLPTGERVRVIKLENGLYKKVD